MALYALQFDKTANQSRESGVQSICGNIVDMVDGISINKKVDIYFETIVSSILRFDYRVKFLFDILAAHLVPLFAPSHLEMHKYIQIYS